MAASCLFSCFSWQCNGQFPGKEMGQFQQLKEQPSWWNLYKHSSHTFSVLVCYWHTKLRIFWQKKGSQLVRSCEPSGELPITSTPTMPAGSHPFCRLSKEEWGLKQLQNTVCTYLQLEVQHNREGYDAIRNFSGSCSKFHCMPQKVLFLDVAIRVFTPKENTTLCVREFPSPQVIQVFKVNCT